MFFPTNFEHYISQMELRDDDQNVVDPNPTAETLITGPDSKDLHLNTRTEVDCVHCYDDAFFGLPIDQVRCGLIWMLLTHFILWPNGCLYFCKSTFYYSYSSYCCMNVSV